MIDNADERLAAGEDPVSLSIEKWQLVLDRIDQLIAEGAGVDGLLGMGHDIGYRSCALCLAAIKQHKEEIGDMKFPSAKCKFCSLAAIDQCTNSDSAFSKLQELMTPGNQMQRPPAAVFMEARVLAGRMLANLKRL